MNIFFFTFTLISITTMAFSATLDVYDFDSTIEYPYKSIIISSEESFDKYDSGIPMNRGDMLFYEANGSIQLINNEVVLYYAPKGVVAKLSKDYIEKLNLGSITPFEDLPSPPVGFQDPEELPRDQAISEFLAFYDIISGKDTSISKRFGVQCTYPGNYCRSSVSCRTSSAPGTGIYACLCSGASCFTAGSGCSDDIC